MTDRSAIADALDEIGLLLELSGENPFKSRAYASGARILRSLDADLAELIQTKRLSQIKGIGPALADKIATLASTGSLPYLDTLRTQIPAGLRDWLKVPGLGPKKARVIHVTLGIATLDELEAAARDGKLRDLGGFGDTTEKKILEGIGRVRSHAGRFLRPTVLVEARRLVALVAAVPGVIRAEVAGSVRRCVETSKDIDIVVAAADAAPVMDAFVSDPGVAEVTGRGPTKCSVRLAAGPAVDLRVVPEASFGAAMCYFTGSKAHNVALRGRALKRGLTLNEYALTRTTDGTQIPCPDEETVYAALGLPFIPPELREDAGEMEAAEAGKLPKLLEPSDLRGILHCHSTWSDGVATIHEMAEAARALGASYLGLCDHSRSAAYAGGMSVEKAREQHAEIDRINAAYGRTFRVLKGIEVDILADGTLDYPDEVLAGFELVVASVHSRFNLSAEEQTARMIRAVQSPCVDIVGHPTGRILLTRDGYPLDLDAVVSAAAERGVAVEVNAYPNRLDLAPVPLRRGLAKGLTTSIDPDAHRTDELPFTAYGVETARRGWAEAEDVLNTRPLDELLSWLSERRARALA
ncbi:MAG TPA: DNA polymerase/3'-5' exonuclease PolX [Candidatus Polarisedimenticolaceae bacterium]|nr:DNA polymerase/3'-5' exonuclease PolX [Candidatus Polarisedimenticolaceae bacterium]